MPQIEPSSDFDPDAVTSSFEVRAMRMRAVFIETEELTQTAARRARERHRRRDVAARRGPSRSLLAVTFALFMSGGALAWNGDTIAEWLERNDPVSGLANEGSEAKDTLSEGRLSPRLEPPKENEPDPDESHRKSTHPPVANAAEKNPSATKPPSSRSTVSDISTQHDAWQRVALALGQDDLEQAQAEADRLRASAKGSAREAAILLSAQLEVRAKGAMSVQTRRDLQMLARNGSLAHVRREATRLLGE